MSSGYRETKFKLPLPVAGGEEVLVHLLRSILRQSHVTLLKLDKDGVEYARFVKEGEEPILQVDYTGTTPYDIARHGEMEEILLADAPPHSQFVELLQHIDKDGSHPVCFVCGPETDMWEWFGCKPRPRLFGVPVYAEVDIGSETLLLCTSYEAGGMMSDIKKTYKINMSMMRSEHGQAE